MTTLQIRFNNRRYEQPNLIQKTQPFNTPHQMKQIRSFMTHQVSQIDQNPLIKSHHQPISSFNKQCNNPETTSLAPKEEFLKKKLSLRSNTSVISGNQTSTSTRRRNTFLTVVSRLPKTKKRSESVF